MMIVYTIAILCVLIFVHELGHFIAAKSLGVKVNEFALGMGPAFFKKQKGETLYALRILPIGGFCAMEGEDEDSDDHRAFNKKPGWKKAIILSAGSIMNVLLAILIVAGMLLYGGQSTIAAAITEGSPAQAAGIRQDDRIVSIEGKEVYRWQWVTLTDYIQKSTGETIEVGLVRDGERMTVNTGVAEMENGRRIIGITMKKSHNPLVALAGGTYECGAMVGKMMDMIGQLFTGKVPVKELTGPVGIAYIVDDTATKYGFAAVLSLVPLISLNLAIVNLLPFPALDGGRLLFLLIRKITGRAISDTVEGRIHMIGLMLLFMLMIYVAFNDVGRFIIGT